MAGQKRAGACPSDLLTLILLTYIFDMSIIVFKTVTQKFPDGTVAFSDLDFEIDEGEKVLITGPSGSGKTTIMRLLIGEYQPTQGEVLFEGTPLIKAYHNRWHIHRRQVGVIFQDYKLIEELNVWENVALPLLIRGERQETIEERVTDLLSLVELTDKAYMFPKQLSGGEAQRISIARALANSPKVIFADEPTGNLDLDNTKHILKLLTKINELGTTLILATHDPFIIDQLKVKRIDLTKSHAADNQPKNEDTEKKELKKEEKVQKKKNDEKKQDSENEKSKKDDERKEEVKEKKEDEKQEDKKGQEKSKENDSKQKKTKRVSSLIKKLQGFFPKKHAKKINLEECESQEIESKKIKEKIKKDKDL